MTTPLTGKISGTGKQFNIQFSSAMRVPHIATFSLTKAATTTLLCSTMLFVGNLYAQTSDDAKPLSIDANNTIIHPIRNFGYVLGDVLTQKILLTTNATLEDELPLNRANIWLKRLSADTVVASDGQYALSIEYQIVNSPDNVQQAQLPALDLFFSDYTAVSVDPWPFTLGPITPPAVQINIESIQPDHSPTAIDNRSTRRLMQYALLALTATLLTWIGWWFWRQYNDKVRLPFAQAHHKIKQLGGTTANNNPQSWFNVHDAINASAGRTVQQVSLPALIKHKPWLAPMEHQLSEFFVESSARFFAQTQDDQAHPPQRHSFALYKLSKQLMRAEKGQSK